MSGMSSFEYLEDQLRSLGEQSGEVAQLLTDLRRSRDRLTELRASCESAARAAQEAALQANSDGQARKAEWEQMTVRAEVALSEWSRRQEELSAALMDAVRRAEEVVSSLESWKRGVHEELWRQLEAGLADLGRRQEAFERDQFRKLEDIHQAYRLVSDRLREFEDATERRLAGVDATVEQLSSTVGDLNTKHLESEAQVLQWRGEHDGVHASLSGDLALLTRRAKYVAVALGVGLVTAGGLALLALTSP